MAGTKLPYFKFYPQDFMGDERVQLMGPTELGVYIAMICHAWQKGSVPDDPAVVSRICRGDSEDVERAWPLVRPCFIEHPSRKGQLTQARLERERLQAETRVEKAKKAAAIRHADDAPSNAPSSAPSKRQAGRKHVPSQNPELRSSENTETDTRDKSRGEPAAVDNSRQALLDGGKGTVGAWLLPICRETVFTETATREMETTAVDIAWTWLKKGEEPDRIEEMVRGFALARDYGEWRGWIEPGESVGLRPLNMEHKGRGIPNEKVALHYWRKHGGQVNGKRERGDLEPIDVGQLAREGEQAS